AARADGHGEKRQRGENANHGAWGVRLGRHSAPDAASALLVPTYDRPMAVLRSRLDPASDETRANHNAMCALVADLGARQGVASERGAGGDELSIARHRERGKLPVRERIDRLLDPGSAFL